MPAYVLMKAFENAPAQYDGALEVLSLGRISRLKAEIAARVAPGSTVLELGCGAGSLAATMARQGAHVVGIDTSASMLESARVRLAADGLAARVDLRRLSVMEIDAWPPDCFDCVVSTMVLSELSEDELAFVLAAARRVLKPGGELLIGDETVPTGRWRRLGFGVLRWPLQLVTYLVLQAQGLAAPRWATRALYFAIELPLMLLVFFFVPPTSRPLPDLAGCVERAGFRIHQVRAYLGGTLTLIHAGAP